EGAKRGGRRDREVGRSSGWRDSHSRPAGEKGRSVRVREASSRTFLDSKGDYARGRSEYDRIGVAAQEPEHRAAGHVRLTRGVARLHSHALAPWRWSGGSPPRRQRGDSRPPHRCVTTAAQTSGLRATRVPSGGWRPTP